MEIFLFVPPRRYVAASKSPSVCQCVVVISAASSGSACTLPSHIRRWPLKNSAGVHSDFLPMNSHILSLSSQSNLCSLQQCWFCGKPTDADSSRTSKSICIFAHFLLFYRRNQNTLWINIFKYPIICFWQKKSVEDKKWSIFLSSPVDISCRFGWQPFAPTWHLLRCWRWSRPGWPPGRNK